MTQTNFVLNASNCLALGANARGGADVLGDGERHAGIAGAVTDFGPDEDGRVFAAGLHTAETARLSLAAARRRVQPNR